MTVPGSGPRDEPVELRAVTVEHSTIRLLLFEVYEQGARFPMFVTSDRSLIDGLVETDRIVKRWWVREGAGDA